MRVLSNYEENEVLNRVKKIARESCHTEILNFAECSKGRTFSVIWSCREVFDIMNKCTSQYTNRKFSEEQKLQYLKEHP
ncbi:hypothetical protein DSO57_1019108 [Entomophthora muscae]|uniref:Uncharacterized protein n=1 Tax=Entomophthora muscae TaxID=34485 RepID=A0ACC2UEW1_9FUNG|nr:hypothetical protein DSO57_1019108 [Entomophthora muscae]